MLVILPLPAFAISTLSISSPAADGVFVLRGVGLEAVSGLQISVSYDSATLSNPRIALGSLVSGMYNATNPGNPIQVAIVSTTKAISDTGTIATITFERTGASPGRITALTGTLIDLQGAKVAMAQPIVIDPPGPSTPAPGQQPGNPTGTGNPTGNTGNAGTDTNISATGRTATATTPSRTVAGTVTFPSNETPANETNEPAAIEPEPQIETAPQETPEPQGVEGEVPAEESAAPVPEADETKAPEPEATAQPAAAPPAAAPPAAAPPAAAPQPVQTVLERFRVFEGERTVQNQVALFHSRAVQAFSQSPAIAIADGEATVRLTISRLAGDKAPNFTFNSARFVSLARSDNGEWEVEVRPEKDAIKASVGMLYNGMVQELPLTVAPEANVAPNKSGDITEADFQLFLKERGTASAPKFDLNGDGRRDYIDDYIFTASYLVKMEEKATRKQGAQSQAPSPLMGEGWGEGEKLAQASPSPPPPPIKGGGATAGA